MVVQKSISGGYHFFYRCDKIEKNQKLARRNSTEAELLINNDEKVKGLIETRGEGGFIMTYPSKGYEWIYGDLSKICTITESERDVLIDCAMSFNEVFDVVTTKRKEYTSNNTVFEKSNESGDVEVILEEHGWDFKGVCNGNRMYLRPNGTGLWSAGYHPE